MLKEHTQSNNAFESYPCNKIKGMCNARKVGIYIYIYESVLWTDDIVVL